MGDETMVLYYDSLSKRELMEWRHPGSPQPKIAKATQSQKRSWPPFSGIVREFC
jgi:hypothetical protein